MQQPEQERCADQRGDHANRKQDFSGPFKKEIDFLATAGLKPDIFFAPVSGCGFGDLEGVKKGVYYTIKKLKDALYQASSVDSYACMAFAKHPDNISKEQFWRKRDQYLFHQGANVLLYCGMRTPLPRPHLMWEILH